MDAGPDRESTRTSRRDIIAFRAALTLAHVDLGELEDARNEFRRLASIEFGGVPRDAVWTMSLAVLAQVCAHLGEAERALQLYGLLTPHANHLVVGWSGIACLGAVDRFLGMLAATNHEWERAEEHYRVALALESRIESAPLLARTQIWYARMLLGRNASGDGDQARELLSSAQATSESLGMAAVVGECQDLQVGHRDA